MNPLSHFEVPPRATRARPPFGDTLLGIAFHSSQWRLGLLASLAAGVLALGCDTGSQATCGDGARTGSEPCDGSDLGGETCASLGFGGGQLACTASCELDESGCEPPPLCGNGELDSGEECDGSASLFGDDASCSDLGFSGAATLTCGADCHHDVRPCSSERCDDRWDNDGDGYVDCDDPDCLGLVGCPGELCYDAQDNDSDGMADCADWDCAANFPACNAGLYPSENAHHGLCGNARDDDADGLEDREDPDCVGRRSVLFVKDQNGGAFTRGESLIAELVVYADTGDLEGIRASSLLPEGLDLIDLSVDGTSIPESHSVEWGIQRLAWGTAVTLWLEASISTALDFGAELCLSVTLESTVPTESWQTDDPDSIGQGLPSCVVLR